MFRPSRELSSNHRGGDHVPNYKPHVNPYHSDDGCKGVPGNVGPVAFYIHIIKLIIIYKYRLGLLNMAINNRWQPCEVDATLTVLVYNF